MQDTDQERRMNRSSVHLQPTLPPLPDGAGLRAVQAVARIAEPPPVDATNARWRERIHGWQDRIVALAERCRDAEAGADPPPVAPYWHISANKAPG